MHALILGPTGTAGAEALRQALAHPQITRVTTLHRRTTGVHHPKLEEVIHEDFTDYSGLEAILASVDICLFCLGISQMKEKDRERFFRVTHDFPVSLATALHDNNPEMTFCFLSGAGADPTGRSSLAFPATKGRAETSLVGLSLKHLYIFRPGYIHPDQPHDSRMIGEVISGYLYPALKVIVPGFVIHSKELARGMLHVGIHCYPKQLLRNNMIKEVGKDG
jgi:uncharacterized protein YbjT (DUF2867 family)